MGKEASSFGVLVFVPSCGFCGMRGIGGCLGELKGSVGDLVSYLVSCFSLGFDFVDFL